MPKEKNANAVLSWTNAVTTPNAAIDACPSAPIKAISPPITAAIPPTTAVSAVPTVYPVLTKDLN